MVAMSISPPTPQASNAKRSVKKRTGTTRGRTGCVTCRQRRKKCEENTYPICGHCKRLNLECVREAPRSLPNSPKDTDDVLELPSHISRIPDAVQVSNFIQGRSSTDSRYLLRYYTSILSSLCTTNHENNSFLSVFLPMAMESPPLLTSIIAWSSAHLSFFDPSYSNAAMENQSQAFTAVAKSLSLTSGSDALRETELASCLVLCATEVSLGDTSRWYDHLVGAKHIIMPAKKNGPGGRVMTGTQAFLHSLDGAWLLRNFAYHDILGSVTNGEEPLIKGNYFYHDDVEVIDAYCGCGTRLLGLISEVSCLSLGETESRIVIEELDSESSSEEPEDEDIWQPFRALGNKIREWTSPPVTQQDLVSMAYAYRGATSIHLYRKWRLKQQSTLQHLTPEDISLLDSKMFAAVEDTMHHISKVQPTSLPECGLLFPLFMAGGETRDPAHIEVIRIRLKALLDHRGFRNIKTATDVLEELWRLKACGLKNRSGFEVDWMDVIQRHGIKLLLA